MIIIDLNQVMLSNFFASVGKHTNINIELPLMRHMILNTIRSINVKFRKEYGELVIASDSPQSWRREYFPYYKAARKKTRTESDIDWKSVFECLQTVKEELEANFPYVFIQVDRCEADDVIGRLVYQHAPTNPQKPIMIVSADKDFKQLHLFKNVQQYDPIRKRSLTTELKYYIGSSEDWTDYLVEHIIAGDRGDGVPNILSEDNVFVTDARQKKLTSKRFAELEGIEDRQEDKYYRNWIRNRTLIDLRCTPDDLKTKIDNAYERSSKLAQRNKQKVFPYIMRHGMNNLAEKVNDFRTV